jgi:hypothetical protein
MKTTFNGRQPQNMKSGISQQPLVGTYSNLKLELMELNQNAQRSQTKNNLKILEVLSQQPLVGSYSN